MTPRHPLLLLALAPVLLTSCGTAPVGAQAPADSNPGWMAEVTARLRDGAHAFVADGAGFVAEVPERQLHARFDAAGAHIDSGEDDQDSPIVVRSAGFGRASEPGLTPMDASPELGECQDGMADPAGRCIQRLEYSSPGATEWWASLPDGFEQGWHVTERAAGHGPLLIDVQVSGADATVSADGVSLQGDDGSALFVNRLAAWDANGQTVEAWFERTADGFRVVVDDEGAVYPLEVDPMYTTSSWSAEGSSLYSTAFGARVAGAGDVNGDGYDDLLVSNTYTHLTVTTVYLFEGSATGVSNTATVTIPGPTGDSYFGSTLDGVGDVNGDSYDDVVIGSYNEDSGTGTALVYYGSASSLPTSADLTLTGAAPGYDFGISVHGAGDVNSDGYADVIIGASGYGSDTGQAYVYHGSGSGLSPTAATTLTGVNAGDYFGFSVANAGDVNNDGYDDVIVGAYAFYYSSGRAYLFAGSATGVGTTPNSLVSGAASSWSLGYTVAAAGDVNRDGYDDVLTAEPGYGTYGQVIVWRGSATGLTVTGAVSLTTGSIGDGAGDVDGDGYADVIVGSSNANSYTGAAYLYTGGSTGVDTTADATVTGVDTSNYFGASVAGVGDTNGDGYDDVIVGGYGYASYRGSAWTYLGSRDASLGTSTQLARTYDYLGISVSSAGDVNDDGYADVIVGASGYLDHLGQALVYEGTASGLESTASTTLVGVANDDYFGCSVSGVGDLNDDGYDDVVVGAYNHDSDGAAYAYLGSAAGVSTTAVTTIASSSSTDELGAMVAPAGDANGDGYDDVMVASTGDWKVLVYHGNATGLNSTATRTLTLPQTPTAIASVGDTNGDGYDDIAIGGSSYSGSYSNGGRVYVYRGSSGGIASTATTTLSGAASSNYFGCSVAGAGDVNADGYDDLVVGAYGYSSRTGRAYVYPGSASGISTTALATLTGSGASDYFGRSVSGGQDLENDGYDDVLVVAYGADATGEITTYAGSATGPGATASSTLTGIGTTGTAVAWAGDVNGDGAADILVGNSTDNSNTGRVTLYESTSDADGDGVLTDLDCDDTDPAVGEPSAALYADSDSDSYGDPASTAVVCPGTAGYVDNALDCDDTSSSVRPSATERCDAYDTDEDCDGLADDADSSAIGQTTFYTDGDGDGYGDLATAVAMCDPSAGVVATATDCNDASDSVSPGASEICDAANTDEDCDGLVDDSDPSATGQATVYADADGDGYGGTPATFCDAPSSYVATGTDCNDSSASINPAAAEICDASDSDEDCDGLADDADPSAAGTSRFYLDSDTDGYGGSLTTTRCDAAPGFVATSTDCNDGSTSVNPGAAELCDASDTDEDCDGLADDADSSATGLFTFYADSDSDGYGGSTTRAACELPVGYLATSTDCNDASAAIHPGAAEICDASNTDEDCDSLADDADSSATGETAFYVDGDGDSYGGTVPANRCDAAAGYASTSTDCDDADTGDYPTAPETVANGDDEDCDSAEICYVDADSDGYRGPATLVSADTDCADAGEALATAAGDCDDLDATVHSGGTEVTGDGIDGDCDGQELCFTDEDDDGYRPDDLVTVASLDADCDDVGEATVDDLTGDCDDTNPAYNPVATEANCADSNDYNCDGSVGYADADGDGFAACEECDDTRTAVNPDGVETCNSLDDDCNGSVDDNAVDATVWYADFDGDGYTNPAESVTDCTAPDGYAAASLDDCDDANASAHPGAVDVPGDGIDQDCDGVDTPVEDSGGETAEDSGRDTDSRKDGGCGCSTAPSAPGLGALLLLGAGLTRRRSSRQRG